jgi:lambda family phage portal protein
MREIAYDLERNIERHRIYENAVSAVASQLGRRPVLYGPDNRPLRPQAYGYTYSRKGAQRQGTMTNWIPKRLYDPRVEAAEREKIVERSVDLCQDNPFAAGIKQTFAVTVINSGLTPLPAVDHEILGISKEEARTIQAQIRAIYTKWYSWADAGERMNFGSIQYLCEANTIQYGEHVVLPLMLDDPVRPYSLACQVVNPMRLRTPTDKLSNGNIRDGVEIDRNGTPVAYWIKKSNDGEKAIQYLPDTSVNFLRLPARIGHRPQVLHRFIVDDAEKVRGVTFFAPALKYFLDLNDLLDAELVSNIVTAAFSMFIETGGGNPYGIAEGFSSFSEDRTKSDGTTEKTRYQELIPGMVYYGNTGEKPHPITANRPGTTFDPFIKVILKAVAASVNMPYIALFKDLDNATFAVFRGAMLEAWRVYSFHRAWIGEATFRPIYKMLMEEAYLRGELKVKNFYTDMELLTQVDWSGYPKGDIEPIKAAQADILLIKNNLKTRAKSISERGDTMKAVFDQLEEEQEELKRRGLSEEELSREEVERSLKEDNDEK